MPIKLKKPLKLLKIKGILPFSRLKILYYLNINCSLRHLLGLRLWIVHAAVQSPNYDRMYTVNKLRIHVSLQ